MSYVGDYDPTGFDQSDVATWPGAPATEYVAGDWWYVTAPGTVDGVAVDVGDRLYPVGVGRRYGELQYGDAVYGGPIESPFPADSDRIHWSARSTSLPAWMNPAPPYGGCEVATGYRLVVELLTVDPDARLYGDGTYGSGTYGDERGIGIGWSDITPSSFGIVIRRGEQTGTPYVDVEQLTMDVRDRDAELFPLGVPQLAEAAGVGTMIRVSLIDSLGEPFEQFAGRIERVDDVHDDDAVRTVVVEAFGVASDTATTITNYSAEEETASTRMADLFAASGYAWGPPESYPSPDPLLRRVDELDQANARAQLQRAAVSAGWLVDADRRGVARVRRWPLEPASTNSIEVTDRKGVAALASPRITFVADAAETLNVAGVESEAVQGAAAIVVEHTDATSIARVGRRSEALDFPLSGLSAKVAQLDEIAERAVDRYARIVNRVESVVADTSVDARWLPVLVDLDTGDPMTVTRSKPRDLVSDSIVVGYDHRIIPGRWTSTIYLSTMTNTY